VKSSPSRKKSVHKGHVLALFPFFAEHSMPLSILRAARRSGFRVSVACYMATPAGIAIDSVIDFQESNSVLDMKYRAGTGDWTVLQEFVTSKRVDFVIQVGSPYAYQQIAYLKESTPSLPVIDWLFNDSEHFHRFSQFSSLFYAVIVESEKMRETVMELPSPPAVKVIRSGTRFKPNLYLERPAPNSERTRVAFVGRLSPEKNALGFVEFAKKLVDQTGEFEFSVSGLGPEKDEILSSIESFGKPELLRFHEYEPDVHDALRKLDVLVVPSKLDGRPAIIMEANARGIPVVATNVGGIPEMITEGVNGFMFDSGDFSGFRKAIMDSREKLLSREGVGWASEISDYAENHFSRDTMESNYMKFFNEVLEASSQSDD